jgi:TRAP transporter 4TM/12TM fusion protein
MAKELCPNARRALMERWHLVLPLAVLVFLLFDGFTPLFAGTIGLMLTAMLILGATVVGGVGQWLLRVLFWVGLGLAAAALYRVARLPIETTAVLLVAGLVVVTFVVRGGRETLRMLVDAMADAAKSALSVGVACALVGILIGATTLTGLASDLARMILALAGDSLFLALLMTMLACLVLGTGLPTIPNYIITAAMAAPALLELGVPLIVSHMFVFYFGIMADLTPPVALACLAAQSIAKVSHMKISFTATKLGIAGYVMPFMFVYTPALMLQGGTPLEVAYIFAKAVLAIGLWGAAATGWGFGPMIWAERIGVTVAAVLLVFALPWTDPAGFALAALTVGWHWWRHHRLAQKPA